MHLAALGVQLFGYRQRDCAAYAAAHNADLAQPLSLGRLTERTRKIGKAVSHVFMIQLFGGSAHNLKYNFNRTLLAVKARNGKRNTLAVFIGAEDNELTRLGFFSHKRRFNIHHGNGWVQVSFAYDFKHFTVSFLK